MLRGLVVVFTFLCLGEVLWTAMLLTVVPLFACLFLFCISFGGGREDMTQNYSCAQIAIGNIFLFLFCVVRAFGKHIYKYFRSEIWECIWNKRRLFPATMKVLELMDS
jgi:hypothetical protein